ncbi:type II toxin-antitoxin system VapC family toxin [Ruania alkalisoli]|uniref:Ribonuclease VapC n=1 Tax=Ruania alkalisoli TaxID=2779775 RepID=A0A7M1SP57_9MICO|nr:type II toxin-antitoxin system VapC family toxin [Ruania alkalisoli]QOR69340.1 type II toxin-antitoxin system VapC family toxin [Ruania alkalisoli]
MIVVDTNVLSEPLRPSPDPLVLAWLAGHQQQIALTTISIAELLYGARRLPKGRGQSHLLAAIDQLVESAADRLYDFDRAAAASYASLRSERDRAGQPGATEDLMIAGICRVHHASLATRNGRDFLGCGLQLIDPWSPHTTQP